MAKVASLCEGLWDVPRWAAHLHEPVEQIVTERGSALVMTHVVLRDERTKLPPPSATCRSRSLVIDPTYEIIHWTPELRKEFSERHRP